MFIRTRTTLVAFFFSIHLLACHEQQPTSDQQAAFVAAGFHKTHERWTSCADPGSSGYKSGTIDQFLDINGDGRPDAVIYEASTFCYGDTGVGYSIVSKQTDGNWKRLDQGDGFVSFLATKGAEGWPDIEIGGPGSCFPVKRWNGHAFVPNGYRSEHGPCQPTNLPNN